MPSTLSPFRYPGGKSQLYPFVSNLLRLNKLHGTYIEPFSGGFGVGLKLLFNDEVRRVVINDLDNSIYSVWWAIIDHPDYLISKINAVPFDFHEPGNDTVNLEFWKRQQKIFFESKNNKNSLEGAFATLFLNRTNVSGILTGGPVGGSTQSITKISARFNKQTLISKIMAINSYKNRISLYNYDAADLIRELPGHFNSDDTFVFFDPPYFEQGGNLYYSSFDDNGHAKLAKQILALNNFKWIVTYDDQPQIKAFYSMATGKYEFDIRYSANNKNRKRSPELMFSSPDLKMESFAKTRLQNI